jgi:hypothetical protein
VLGETHMKLPKSFWVSCCVAGLSCKFFKLGNVGVNFTIVYT